MRAAPSHVRRAAWLFSAPAVFFQFFFGWFPVAVAFLVAFQRYYLAKDPEMVGVANFVEVARDPLTQTVFLNTLHYGFLSLALTFLMPIVVSVLLLEMSPRLVRIMMVLWFIPVASTAGIVIWKYAYNPNLGLMNRVMELLHLPPQRWLDDPGLAMFSLILPGVILYGPGLVYIAALQGIPDELYEAAEIEGAGVWAKLRHITLPRIRPVVAMMLVLSTIGAFQVFEQPFLLTSGGPGYSTTTVVMHVYNLAFRSFNLGKATALSIVLFFVIMLFVVIQRRYFPENIDDANLDSGGWLRKWRRSRETRSTAAPRPAQAPRPAPDPAATARER
jgi:multiple sugar transport system permease protein